MISASKEGLNAGVNGLDTVRGASLRRENGTYVTLKHANLGFLVGSILTK